MNREKLPYEDRIIHTIKLKGAAVFPRRLAETMGVDLEHVGPVVVALCREKILYRLGNGSVTLPELAFTCAEKHKKLGKEIEKAEAKKAKPAKPRPEFIPPKIKPAKPVANYQLKRNALKNLGAILAPDIAELLDEIGADLKRLDAITQKGEHHVHLQD